MALLCRFIDSPLAKLSVMRPRVAFLTVKLAPGTCGECPCLPLLVLSSPGSFLYPLRREGSSAKELGNRHQSTRICNNPPTRANCVGYSLGLKTIPVVLRQHLALWNDTEISDMVNTPLPFPSKAPIILTIVRMMGSFTVYPCISLPIHLGVVVVAPPTLRAPRQSQCRRAPWQWSSWFVHESTRPECRRI